MTTAGRLFLDSADLDDAREAALSGIVSGITTNPSILAASTRTPLTRLGELLDVFQDGPVFHQLTASDDAEVDGEVAAIREAMAGHSDRLVLKLPAQPMWYRAGAKLAKQGWPVAFTAVYDPGQAVCAVEAGATWIIPYVDRSARLRPDSDHVVTSVRPFLPADVVLLAASLKSPTQALDALRAGANAVTTSWEVIAGLMTHTLTESAVEEFKRATDHAKLSDSG